jgi:hypothetical protein
MSEHLWKILLAELETVCVTCNHCKTEFGFPLANLEQAFLTREGGAESWACPHCHAQVQGESSGAATHGPFSPLLRALRTLKDLQGKIRVQFVVRKEDSPPAREGGGTP